SLRRTRDSWLDSARDYLPARQTGAGPATVGLTALGCVAAGLGAMWLFDPERGRSRRAWIGQKATRLVNETGTLARATGRHLANKSRGYYYESRNAVGSGIDRLSDTGIAESVRSTLGRLGLRSSDSVGVACED